MKSAPKLSIIILLVFAINADAQQKTYTGPFQIDDNLFKGTATYQYYENAKLERVFNEDFKFTCIGDNKEVVSIQGHFIDNAMNGIWNLSINYPNDIYLLGQTIKSHQVTGTGKFTKGNKEGQWILKNVEKGNTNTIVESANFNNNKPIGIWKYSETKAKIKFICQFNNDGLLNGEWINQFVDEYKNPIEDIRKYRDGILYYRVYRNLSSGEIIEKFDSSIFVSNFFDHYDTSNNLADINNIPYRIYKEENKIDLKENEANGIYVLIRQITDFNDLFIIQRGSNKTVYENFLIAKDENLLEERAENENKAKLEKERQVKQEIQKATEEANKKYDSLFINPQIPAQFPGGEVSWNKYLERNLNTDVVYENKAPKGKYNVMVIFIIDKEGNVSDIQTENDPGYGTKEEAIRVIKKGPKWIPALQDGHIVSSRHKQIITFLSE